MNSFAQESTTATQETNGDARVVATVGEYSLTHGDVQRQLFRTIGPIDFPYPDAAYMIAVQHLVDQEVAFQFLDSENRIASKNEIATRAERLKQELAKVGKTISDYLLENSLTATQLQHQVAWEISWRKFVVEELDEETLKEYFRTRQSHYDGTRLKVAHILWKQKDTGAFATATAAHDLLVAGTGTWGDAVKEHSQAASRDNEGEIGWINFDSPMPTVFSNAAYKLAVNEISPPTESAFGIHLIKCLEIETGRLNFEDVASKVRGDAAKELFTDVSNRYRGQVKIEILKR